MQKAKRFTVIWVALGVLGTGVLLVSCGTSTSNSPAQNNDAKQQFLAERGGTPGVMTDTITFGPGGAGGSPPGVVGAVESINGSIIAVKNPMDNSKTGVHIADGTTIRKQEVIDLSDIKVGDKVTAFGQKDGDLFQAVVVQVGADAAAGDAGAGGPVMFFNGPAPGGAAPSDSGTPQSVPFGGDSTVGQAGVQSQGMGQNVAGTVEKVESGKITVKSQDGSSTVVQPSAEARITRQVDAKLSDISVGDLISASGSLKGDVFEAEGVSILGKVPTP